MGLTKLVRTPWIFKVIPLNFEKTLLTTSAMILENDFSTLCDAKNNIKFFWKKAKMETLFSFLNLRPGGIQR